LEKNNPQQPMHIMIVDDDRLVLAALSRGLKDAGYRVSAAANGEDAYAITMRDPPDLALLDMRMPGMNGIELGRRLRERVPFLYLSAYGDEDTVRDGVAQGALGYLVKPLDIAQILPTVQAALARAAEIRALHEKETQLMTALATNRETAMAVGLLMERKRLDREQAFELLRARARSARRSVQELARDLLSGKISL
jgi:two-component system, response regulator PdtaR